MFISDRKEKTAMENTQNKPKNLISPLGAQVAKAPASSAFKPTMQFILFAWLPTLLLTTFIPKLSLFLPGLILGYGV